MISVKYPRLFATPRLGSRGESLATNGNVVAEPLKASYSASLAHVCCRSMSPMRSLVCGPAAARSWVSILGTRTSREF